MCIHILYFLRLIPQHVSLLRSKNSFGSDIIQHSIYIINKNKCVEPILTRTRQPNPVGFLDLTPGPLYQGRPLGIYSVLVQGLHP